jgi:hypothetical protein
MCVQSQIVSRWEIMQQFDVGFLAQMSHMCGSHRRTVDEQGYPATENPLPQSIRDDGPETMEPFIEVCAGADLTACVASLARLKALFNRDDATVGDLRKLMDELQGRVIDELTAQRFFSLTLEEARKFNEWRIGWEKVLERFPDTTRDVEEMNKCFALSRYTAAMFHALHIAEWGAINLGDVIGVSDLKKGWGPTERRMREIVKGGRSTFPAGMPIGFEFLEQMSREINTMVLAWRHKVDHAANHLAIIPNTDFTPDIAEHIMISVRVFMLRLMDGLPHA